MPLLLFTGRGALRCIRNDTVCLLLQIDPPFLEGKIGIKHVLKASYFGWFVGRFFVVFSFLYFFFSFKAGKVTSLEAIGPISVCKGRGQEA